MRSPRIRRAVASSKTKVAHIIHVKHRDEVEAPLTDWLHEAYHLQDTPAAQPALTAKRPSKPVAKPVAKKLTKPVAKKSAKPVPRTRR